MAEEGQVLLQILQQHEPQVLTEWLAGLRSSSVVAGRIKDAELEVQCREVLGALTRALAAGGVNEITAPGFASVRDTLSDISKGRASQGFGPSETAQFVFALKQPLFERVKEVCGDDPIGLAAEIGVISRLFDQLGLFTLEGYQKTREEVIVRQQQEIAELSTPVVKLWEGVLALPLIGTLDSSRTQVVMENLLDSIVREGAELAIIDITGVPTVDTLVAQHLLKAVAAARLMGADCIISGIRPQIAQTMVHLGVELNVTTKATMADAFQIALHRTGRAVVRTKAAAGA